MPGVSGASNHHLQPVNDCYCGENMYGFTTQKKVIANVSGFRIYITVERSTVLQGGAPQVICCFIIPVNYSYKYHKL